MSEFWHWLAEAGSQAQGMGAWEAVSPWYWPWAYLLLAMKANIWCWAAAFASTAIYTVLFWKVRAADGVSAQRLFTWRWRCTDTGSGAGGGEKPSRSGP